MRKTIKSCYESCPIIYKERVTPIASTLFELNCVVVQRLSDETQLRPEKDREVLQRRLFTAASTHDSEQASKSPPTGFISAAHQNSGQIKPQEYTEDFTRGDNQSNSARVISPPPMYVS